MIMVSTDKASSQGLTIIHYGVAALSFLLLTILLLISKDTLTGHYFHPQLLAITHITVLGWGVMIIFGALYQFLPVITNAKLFSYKLGVAALLLLGSGTAMLAYAFWFFKVGWEMQSAGILVFSSFIIFSININITIKKAEKGSIAADFIQAASIWLNITAIIGLLMVFNFRFPFLPDSHLVYLQVHAHTGIVGWFLMLIIGVASKLLPMFLLSHPPSETKLKIAYWLINGGLIGYIIDYLMFGLTAPVIYLGLIFSGIIFFISFSYNLIKNRIKKAIDWPMKQSIFALILLILPLLLATLHIINLPLKEEEMVRLSISYVASILLGFVSALILGQTFKTLPFIVWMYVYKNKNLQTRLLPRDLYSERMVALMLWLYIPALCSLIVGVIFNTMILVDIGLILLIMAAVIYCINVGSIFLHIYNPKENEIEYHVS